MGFVVYILRSQRDGSLYVGHTNNIQRRLTQHNDPKSKSYTAKRGPWQLVHAEQHPDRRSAMAREQPCPSTIREPFHRSSCKWAQKIAPENLVGYDSREDAIKDGHRPCKVCKP